MRGLEALEKNVVREAHKRQAPRYYFMHGKEEGGVYRDCPIGVCWPTPSLIRAFSDDHHFTHAYLGYIESPPTILHPHTKYKVIVTQELYKGQCVQLMNRRMEVEFH